MRSVRIKAISRRASCSITVVRGFITCVPRSFLITLPSRRSASSSSAMSAWHCASWAPTTKSTSDHSSLARARTTPAQNGNAEGVKVT